MKKPWKTLLPLVLVLVTLWGCSGTAEPPEQNWSGQTEPSMEMPETMETVPATVPADGNPEDVTCKGSYTGEGDSAAVVASLDGAELTNGELNAFYWAAVGDYRAAGQETAPDFDKPLDTQVCELDKSVNSWHSAQALKLQGDANGLDPEEAYQPNLKNHGIYLTDIPAMKYHYSYNLDTYHPNTLHQAYLDNIPAMLEETAQEKGYSSASTMAQDAFGTSLKDLQAAVELYNRGYMYFTTLSYDLNISQEMVKEYYDENRMAYTQPGKLVDIRHILLVPDDLTAEDTEILETVKVGQDGTVTCSEEAWAVCFARAEGLLKEYASVWRPNEGIFAQLARYHSDDPGSMVNGGSYRNIRQGQLIEELDAWCFDDLRSPGDTTIIRSKYGCHVLYFSGSTTASFAQAEEDLTVQRQRDLVTIARLQYPMEVGYDAIVLSQADAAVSGNDLLYPDFAHERYPEVPLYLQQDYGGTLFGGDLLRTNGCGITTFSMLSSYMTDEEYTPPEMCARYGSYSYRGTDGRIFQLESPVLGYYCKEKTYDPKVAKQALEEGYPVVSLQHKGYWTRGGHYLLVEKMNEDGTVQCRDSNIFNYGKLDGHSVDYFEWKLIPANGSAFWIFEKKLTTIPACSRCGTEGTTDQVMVDPYYICERCTPALLRRGTYQSACAQ